jgi:hypothetical protein
MTEIGARRLKKAMHLVEQGRRRGFYVPIQRATDDVWEELVKGSMAQDEADGIDYRTSEVRV